MIARTHLIGAWGGIFFFLLFFLGFWPLAHFLPGHDPSATAETIAGLYRNNTFGIRLGMVCLMVGAAGFLAFVVSLSAFIRRLEGESNYLSQLQLAGGIAASIFFFLPALLWGLAAFRPERSPELILLINDAGWLLLISSVPPFLVQTFPLAIAVLITKEAKTIFPRWFAYLTLWADLLYIPGMMALFFHSGPFAWNGLFPYWLPISIYAAWILMCSAIMIRGVSQEIASRSAAVGPLAGGHTNS
jgi:hypothetical protein